MFHRDSDFDVSLHMVFLMAGLLLKDARLGSGQFVWDQFLLPVNVSLREMGVCPKTFPISRVSLAHLK